MRRRQSRYGRVRENSLSHRSEGYRETPTFLHAAFGNLVPQIQEQWDFSTHRCETQIADMNVIGKAEIGALVDKLATYFNAVAARSLTT